METLAERIARGPVSELDAIGWAIRLAKRLEALHALGVAHGSVSPACVITAGQDRNARAYLADVQRTVSSLPYQSPERVLGGNLSAADDVWALGATLYALLTGQSPFAASNEEDVRQKILAGAHAPLAVFDVGDDDLQHILDHAFARDIKVRTASIVAFRKSLEEWHPDPSVASLAPLEDEDLGVEEEDGGRTFNRNSRPDAASAPKLEAPKLEAPRPAAAAPARAAGVPRQVAPAPAVEQAAHALMPDADDDEDDARTVMRALAPLMPAAARSAVVPAAGWGPRPTSTVAMPAAYAAPSPAARPAPVAPAPPPASAIRGPGQGPAPIVDEESGDDLRTVMRSPEAMAEGLAAYARENAAGPPPDATMALGQMPEALTLALPSPMGSPGHGGGLGMGPSGQGGLFRTAPMQASVIGQANGHVGMANPAAGPQGSAAFPEAAPAAFESATAPLQPPFGGMAVPPGFPQPDTSATGQATDLALAPSGAIAPAEQPQAAPDDGWTIGKLALAAVIALVVTAGLTFAILRLRGM